MTGLTRTLHRPAKKGAVLKPNGRGVLQVRSAPMWVEEEKVYKFMYLGSLPEGSRRLLAISKDGVHWELPDLKRPSRPAGDLPNRILVQSPDNKWSGFDNVIYDPDDPDPARRFKALLGGGDGRMPGISANGYDYVALPAQVIPSSDESNLVYDRAKRRFIATLKHGNEWGRAVAVSTSTDWLNWTPPRVVFGTDLEDQKRAREVIRRRLAHPNNGGPIFVDPEPPANTFPGKGNVLAGWAADVYNMAVFPYEGMYIGLPAIFYRTGLEPPGNNTDGFYEIQLAVSRDLDRWDRVGDRQPFIPCSQTEDAMLGIYDRNCLLAAPAMEKGEELWFYYTGIKFRNSPYQFRPDRTPRPIEDLSSLELGDLDEGEGAICLAVLRRDGFVSLDATGSGTVMSKPFPFDGAELYVNLQAPRGKAAVEILDERGKPIAGYAKSDCVALSGDATRLAVKYTKAETKALSGRTISLRITLTSASLYSFWVE